MSKVLGIGMDMVDIRRISRLLEMFPRRFSMQFSDKEREVAMQHNRPAEKFAKFWTAKEACVKSIGTGFREEINWRTISIKHDNLGKPYLVFTQKSRDFLKSRVAHPRFHLTIGDEPPYAYACAIFCDESHNFHNKAKEIK